MNITALKFGCACPQAAQAFTFDVTWDAMLSFSDHSSILEGMSKERKGLSSPTGVRVGPAAPVRDAEFPGHLQLHGALPAVGSAGIQRRAGQQPRCGSPGHGRRCFFPRAFPNPPGFGRFAFTVQTCDVKFHL